MGLSVTASYWCYQVTSHISMGNNGYEVYRHGADVYNGRDILLASMKSEPTWHSHSIGNKPHVHREKMTVAEGVKMVMKMERHGDEIDAVAGAAQATVES
jgi:hypothetical protein